MNVLKPDPDTRADIATPKPAYCYTQDHVLQEKKKSPAVCYMQTRVGGLSARQAISHQKSNGVGNKNKSMLIQRLFFTGAFTEDGQRRSPAFVLIFAVFDESKSWYGEVGERRSRERFRRGNDRKEYHTINGYVNATLPGLFFCLLSSTKTICRCRGVLQFALMVFSVSPRSCLSRSENMSRP